MSEQNREPFKYVIENKFGFTSGDVQVTGKIISGQIMVGETIGIVKNGKIIKTKIQQMQVFSKVVNYTAAKGDYVAFIFKGIQKSELSFGDTLVKLNK